MKSDDEYDQPYNEADADDTMVIRMTRRQWWHLDDWRGEHPDRYPKRAAERDGAWKAIEEAYAEEPIRSAETIAALKERWEDPALQAQWLAED